MAACVGHYTSCMMEPGRHCQYALVAQEYLLVMADIGRHPNLIMPTSMILISSSISFVAVIRHYNNAVQARS
jgi:hypothetical protein